MSSCARFARILLIGVTVLPAASSAGVPFQAKKQQAVASVDKHRAELEALSDSVWGFAETALRETRSSTLLADYAESQGFTVRRGAGDLPTAFVAEFGKGRPILGVVGEYDALPGVSQKAQTTREALVRDGAGHGCGHNLLGTGSMGAAVAIRELIAAGKLAGTVRYYGTPAEEAVGGKLYMLRAGLFSDVDACVAWHPDAKTIADTKSSQAIIDMVIEFRGRGAHAAFDPWNGRSAQDGLEILTYSINMMREHVKPTVRMHYAIQDGAKVPNVVPDHAQLWLWIRDSNRKGLEDVMERVRKAAQGAALCADVESELRVQTGDYEMLVNMAGAKLLQANLEWLGPVPFTNEDQEFAKAIQRACKVEEKGLSTGIEPLNEKPGDPEGGSTDVADVSWNVPVIHLSVATAPVATPWHAWPVVACGGTAIGHTGMTYAAKALAATLVDLYENPKALAAVQQDFKSKTQGQSYKGYIPEGPPPLPQK
jgi:aminobenzoyl-glutamate utilization protein B